MSSALAHAAAIELAMPNHDIIVVGASAGGVEALTRLVKSLPNDMPASFFVVLHIAPQSPAMLPSILRRAGKLPVEETRDEQAIELGHVYVASPDYHLLVESGRVRVIRGPKENRHRPAVDPLFRSAAWAYGPRVVGVVLTGTLDDGTAGLWAIKSCGGVAVVQDPMDAAYPGMPTSALQNVDVDYSVPLDQLGPLLDKLARQSVANHVNAQSPEKLKLETQFTMMQRDIRDMNALGQPSAFTCPSCRGALWELHDGQLVRYRCHTGHAFSTESLLAEQSESIENALYSAVRALEEKATAMQSLASRFADKLPTYEKNYLQEAAGLEDRAKVIREIIFNRNS